MQAGTRSREEQGAERNYTFRCRKKHGAGRKKKQSQNYADMNKDHTGKRSRRQQGAGRNKA